MLRKRSQAPRPVHKADPPKTRMLWLEPLLVNPQTVKIDDAMFSEFLVQR